MLQQSLLAYEQVLVTLLLRIYHINRQIKQKFDMMHIMHNLFKKHGKNKIYRGTKTYANNG